MASIDDIRKLVSLDHGLASLSTLRRDGSVQSTVVNAGVIHHPVTGEQLVFDSPYPSDLKQALDTARGA